ncbi:SIS domain-containing protein [bacterium]|nr:SIS domain-containing protein [bacterium]
MFFKPQKTNMEREISEQLVTLPHILSKYINDETNEIKLEIKEKIEKVVLVASGSSYHCARFGVDFIERYAKVEARAIYSSEFLYKNIIPKSENTLYVFITQSGETSDTLKSLELVKKETNLPTLCITNQKDSSIWNLSDYKMACHAGTEKGIAATKSFTAQILCLMILTLKLAEKSNINDQNLEIKQSLKDLPNIVEKVFAIQDEIKKFAKFLAKEKIIVITADGNSYSIAKEGALKIKETSYKNIYAMVLGEFMHGHVAVMNNKATLIYTSAEKISERSINNINNIQKDYCPTLVIIGNSDERIKTDFHFDIETKDEVQKMFANILIFQLIALETALELNCDVDNPKGLHKIVIEKSV